MNRKILNLAPLVILGVFLLAGFLLMLSASRQESAIMDELAHIPAGYGYVKYLDYRLNPEHPPLVKALAALPLIFLDLKFPVSHPAWTEAVNGQWEAGSQFLYHYQNNADQILDAARIFPMILALLTVVLIYVWSKELLGQWWALLPALLFGFSPAVLAHGHYVTTDIGAAFGALLAIFAFTKTLLKPNLKNVFLCGLAFGVAQLTKFSNALLIPYFIILALIFAGAEIKRNLPDRQTGRLNFLRIWQVLKICLLVFIIGLVLIYAVYFLFTLNYPPAKNLTDAQDILQSFPLPWLAKIDLTMIQNSILRPLGEYFLGLLMVLQRSTGGNTGYFLGEVSAGGWWYYFPIVFLLKEPLPALILIFLALIIALLKFKIKNLKLKNLSEYVGLYFAEFSMLLFVVFYWLYSLKSPLNIGVRHLLPTLPFIYILTALGLKSWLKTTLAAIPLEQNLLSRVWDGIKKMLSLSLKTVLISALIIWYVGEGILGYPYFLSYFNQIGGLPRPWAGGIKNGWRYVTDSNYDWGQDLKRLKSFVEEKKIEKIGVDYFGGGDPKYYLGGAAEYWQSAHGNPSTDSGQVPKIEWLAVSVNTLQGAMAQTAPGFERKPEDSYEWLTALRPKPAGLGQVPPPDFRAGTSIFIYHF